MEELHKTHKDVPFGWVLWLQEAVNRLGRDQRSAASARRAPAKAAHG